jgi:methionyl-tRNA formyltransferase
MAGDTMTGVTIIQIDEGLDSGDVLTAQAVDIQAEEDAGLLTGRLSNLGASLLVGSIDGYLSGSISPVLQSDDGLTYASKLTNDDRPLPTELAPGEFVARVRGLAPRPGATLQIENETVKILAASASDAVVEPGFWKAISGTPVVGLFGGSVEILQIQPPGKKAMSGDAWLRGRPSSGGSLQ